MKAAGINLLEFLKKSEQFVIPIYQRLYNWKEKECQQFLNDILKTGKNEDTPSHFLGSIVYVRDSIYQVSDIQSLLVIDGQQRLVTISILLKVLADVLGDKEILSLTSKKIESYYLIDSLQKDENKYKLLLTETDKESLISLLDHVDWPREHSVRIKENYEFFKSKLGQMKDEELKCLITGIKKLMIVDISLDRSCDNPQLIFESMNSTGLKLSQIDLIRNFLLMGLDRQTQKEFYKHYWKAMEDLFGQEKIDKYFNRFIRDYLTIKIGSITNFDLVYDEFKKYQRSNFQDVDSIRLLLKELLSFSKYYTSIFLGKEENPKLKDAFSAFKHLGIGVSAPFLLQVYKDYEDQKISLDEFVAIANLIESYVFRRTICAIPSISFSKTFAEFYKKYVQEDNYLESVKAGFQVLQSYKSFPSDKEFIEDLKVNANGTNLTHYLLEKLENFDRKEKISSGEYTIEHIMPQTLTRQWEKNLGKDFEEIHEEYINNLGNLTLTGYNSEYSNRSFKEKKTIKGGFNESPLKLNKSVKNKDTWDEKAIQNRAKKLAAKAVKIWRHPNLDKNVVESYFEKPKLESQKMFSLKVS